MAKQLPQRGVRAVGFRFFDPSVYSHFVAMIRRIGNIFTDSSLAAIEEFSKQRLSLILQEGPS